MSEIRSVEMQSSDNIGQENSDSERCIKSDHRKD